jgi:hypothetical protein
LGIRPRYAQTTDTKRPLERIIPPRKSNAVADAMAASAARTSAAVERNLKVADEVITKLDGSIANKVRHPRALQPDVLSESADIRWYIQNQVKKEDRMMWITKQVEAGDISVTNAVLGYSCWASGLTPSEAQTIREIAERRMAPAEVEQRAAMARARKIIETAMNTYTETYSSRLPKRTVNAGDLKLKSLREGVS